MCIRMRIRIRIIILMRIRILILVDADPDAVPGFYLMRTQIFTLTRIRIQKWSNRHSIHFGLSSADWCGSGSLWCGSGFGSGSTKRRCHTLSLARVWDTYRTYMSIISTLRRTSCWTGQKALKICSRVGTVRVPTYSIKSILTHFFYNLESLGRLGIRNSEFLMAVYSVGTHVYSSRFHVCYQLPLADTYRLYIVLILICYGTFKAKKSTIRYRTVRLWLSMTNRVTSSPEAMTMDPSGIAPWSFGSPASIVSRIKT